MYLSGLEFHLNIGPGVGLLCQKLILFLVFWGTSILCSIVAPRTHILTNSVRGLPFLHVLLSICYLWWWWWWWCSVAKLSLILCNPVNCSTPGFPVLHYLWEFAQTHAIESMMLSIHLIVCCPLLLLPSIFPSIRSFFSGSALCIR